ncbi:MAG TPA: phosphatase PAP2 family protein [Cellvibrionaceae bacterium]|nr:phosphatase PAP2 family protein [Cellvibrionaceae bacterium]
MTRLAKWSLLDHRLFYCVHRFSQVRLIYWWARICSASGDGFIYGVAALGLWRLQLGNPLKALALGYAIERCIYFIAKPLFRRNRPAAALPHYTPFIQPADKFSFPSGHSSAAFLFATVWHIGELGYSAIAYLWAANIAFSRVMLGVHFISDVVAGAIIGTLIGVGCFELLEAAQ